MIIIVDPGNSFPNLPIGNAMHSFTSGASARMVCPRIGYTSLSSTPMSDRAPSLSLEHTNQALEIGKRT